jgi:hypothetical protein
MVKKGLGKKNKKGDVVTRFWHTLKKFAPTSVEPPKLRFQGGVATT